MKEKDNLLDRLIKEFSPGLKKDLTSLALSHVKEQIHKKAQEYADTPEVDYKEVPKALRTLNDVEILAVGGTILVVGFATGYLLANKKS